MTTQLYLISPPKIELSAFRKQLEVVLAVNNTPTVYGASFSTPTVYGGGKGGAENGFSSQKMPPLTSPPQAGGIMKLVGAFQLRLKDADDAQIKAAIRELLPICKAHEVAFILNDRPDLCSELKCDGVHLGQEDLGSYRSPLEGEQTRSSAKHADQVVGGNKKPRISPPTLQASSDDLLSASPPQGGSKNIERIRSIIGDDAVIGITCHASKHLAMEAGEYGADYVAFGAFYPTTSKPLEKLEKWGTPTFDIISDWVAAATIPCVAIGGITPENCTPIIDAGADFIAVINAVWNHPISPAQAIDNFAKAIYSQSTA